MTDNDRALIEQIAQMTASRAVEKTLISIGVDHNNPIEAQRDMAALRDLRDLIEDEEFRKDLLHLRRWRRTMDNVESKGVFATLGLVAAGGIALILFAFRTRMFGG